MSIARLARHGTAQLAAAAMIASTLVIVPASPALAVTLTVDAVGDTSDANPGDGTCADAAGQCTLRAALDEANSLAGLDTIIVPAFHINLTQESALTVLDDVEIVGSGMGATVIDAWSVLANGTPNTAKATAHGAIQSPGAAALTLRDLTVTGGSTVDGGTDGAGISSSGPLTLQRVEVANNHTGPNTDGGGVHATGPVDISDSWIHDNSADLDGGGLKLLGGGTIVDSQVTGNATTSGRGGGVSTEAGTLSIERTAISDNTAASNGGGVEQSPDGTLNLGPDVVISNNVSSFAAGGVMISGNAASATLDRVRVVGNVAPNAAGGVWTSNGELTIVDSVVESNSTTASGVGGVNASENSGPTTFTATIRRSAIINNTGAVDGGIHFGTNNALQPTVNLLDSTVSGNTGTTRTGGIQATGGGGPLNVAGSTIADNSGPQASAVRGTTGGQATFEGSIIAWPAGEIGCDNWTFASADFNVFSDTGCGAAQPDDFIGDPLLRPLLNNGGWAPSHALLPGSPAIDRFASCSALTDARSVTRPDGACDSGAYELGIVVGDPAGYAGPTDADDANPGDGVCATVDGDCTLRAAVSEANATVGRQGIELTGGINYPLTIVGTNEANNATGDLNVLDGLTIVAHEGTQPRATVSQNDTTDRLMSASVFGGEADLNLVRLDLVGSGTPIAVNGGVLQVSGDTIVRDSSLSGGRGNTGGAMRTDLASGKSAHLFGVEFFDNVSSTRGGALDLLDSGGGVVWIEDSSFQNNETAGTGGGLVNIVDNLTITGNTSFSNNRAQSFGTAAWLSTGGRLLGDPNAKMLIELNEQLPGATSAAGAVAMTGSANTLIRNVAFDQNSSIDQAGGAVAATFSGTGRLDIQRSDFTGNSAQTGSAIAANNDTAIVDSSFTGNTGIPVGLIGPGGAIVGSTIASNSGTDAGGLLVDGPVTIRNSTISGNEATGAGPGAIFVNSGSLDILTSTIANNSATTASGTTGGIGHVGGTVTMSASILSGNTLQGAAHDCNGTIDSGGHNVHGTPPAGCTVTPGPFSDVVGQDPLLSALADNGGLTQTMAIGDASPANDIVTAVDCVAIAPSRDQRGANKPGTAPLDACDAGAFENPNPPPANPFELTASLELADTTLGPPSSTLDVKATKDGALKKAATTDGTADVPFNQVPFNQIDANGVPFNQVPFNQVPFNQVPFNQVPFNQIPFNQIAGETLDTVLLSEFQIRFEHSDPSSGLDGWNALLDVGNSVHAGAPLQSVTFLDVLVEAYDDPGNADLRAALESLTLGDIRPGETAIGQLPITAIALASLTADQMLFRDSEGNLPTTEQERIDNFCAALDSLDDPELTCAALGIYDPANNVDNTDEATLVALSLAGIPFNQVPFNQVPFNQIPFNYVDAEGTPFNQVPFNQVPFNHVQFLDTPFNQVDMSDVDLEGTPFNQVPFNQIPFNQIDFGGVPFNQIPFNQIPFNQVDGAGNNWSALPFNQVPFNYVPFNQVPFNYVAPDGTPFNQVPFNQVPFNQVPFNQVPFNQVPFNQVPFNQIAAFTSINDLVKCDIYDGCSTDGTFRSGLTFGDVATDAVADGHDQGFYFRDALTMGDMLPLFKEMPVQIADFMPWFADGLDDRGALDEYFTDTYIMESLRDDPSAFGGLTLGELDEYYDGVIDWDKVLFATLIWLVVQNPDVEISIGEVVLALTSPSEYKWEALATQDLHDIDPNQGQVPLNVLLDLTGGAGNADDISVDITIPDGFSVGDSALLDPLDSGATRSVPVTFDGTTATLEVDDLPTGGQSTLQVPLISSYSTGQSIVASSVNASFMAAPDEDQLAVEVVEAHEPNDTLADIGLDTDDGTTAPDENGFVPGDDTKYLAEDTILLTHVPYGDDVDLFPVYLEEGERVSIFIEFEGADIDGVLYSPPGLDHSGDELPTVEDDGLNGFVEPQQLEDIPLLDDRLVFEVSANRLGDEERIDTGHIVRTGTYVLQLNGYNGDSTTAPITVRMKKFAQIPLPPCEPLELPFDGVGPTGADVLTQPTEQELADANTLFLVNQTRLHEAYGAQAAQAAIDDLQIVSSSGRTPPYSSQWATVDGQILPVEQYPTSIHTQYATIGAMYQAWKGADLRCDVDFANAIAEEIHALVNSIRADNAGIESIAIIGGDLVIPFRRQIDLTTLANERGHAVNFFSGNNELVSALHAGYYFTDDYYGDEDGYVVADRQVFVPDVAVGRVVETAEEIEDSLERYMTYEGALDPDTTSKPLVAAYDFLADGGEQIAAELDANTAEADDVDSLINETWTAEQLESQWLGENRPIASPNAHFDETRLLPADENAQGGEPEDIVDSTAINSLVDRSIVFTMGCHAGLSAEDLQIGFTHLDWSQALSANGAAYVGNSGYGYGDTDVVALSEELLRIFADNLDGTTTVGDAMMFAKQAYITDVLVNGTYDEKILQEAVTYGLPFMTVGDGVPTDVAAPGPRNDVAPDTRTGLETAPFGWTEGTDGTHQQHSNADGETWYSVDGNIQVTHFRPVVPQTGIDITSGDTTGGLAHEVGFALIDELSHDLVAGVTPKIARPVVDLAAHEPPPPPTDQPFPTNLLRVATGERNSGAHQQLVIGTGQVLGAGDGTGTVRLFDHVSGQLYMRPPGATDRTSPIVSKAQAVVFDGTDVSFQVTVRDPDKDTVPGPDSGIAVVQVLWHAFDANNVPTTDVNWNHLFLSPAGPPDADGNVVFTGNATIPDGHMIEWFGSGGDTAGNGFDFTNKGFLYNAAVAEAPPPGGDIEITVSPTGSGTIQDGWITSSTAEITIETDAPNPKVSVDGGEEQDWDGTPILVSGEGQHSVTVTAAGVEPVTIHFRIDSLGPELHILSPVDGRHYERPNEEDGLLLITTIVEWSDAGIGVDESTVTGDNEQIHIEHDTPTGEYTHTASAEDLLGHFSQVTSSYRVIDLVAERNLIEVGDTATLIVDGADESIASDVTFVWRRHPVHSDKDETSQGSPWAGGEGIVGTHVYTEAGTYVVEVHIDGQVLEYHSITVVDNVQGSVAANGTFDSPQGSWIDEPTCGLLCQLQGVLDDLVEGLLGIGLDDDEAEFGLYAEYGIGEQPDPVTSSFNFQHEFNDFESETVDVLDIVSDSRADVYGTGRWNGSPGYSFRVNAFEGSDGLFGSPDSIRVIIIHDSSGTLVYDNQRGSDFDGSDSRPLTSGEVMVNSG